MRLGRDAPEKLLDDHACSDDLQLVLIGPNLVDFVSFLALSINLPRHRLQHLLSVNSKKR